MAPVTIKNVGRLTQKLNKIAEMDLKEQMVQATKVVHAQAKALAPKNDGFLAGSIHMKVNKNGNNVEGRVFTNVQYALYVEFGTGIKGKGTYPYKIKGLNLTYKDNAWFIPAGDISDKIAERYHFKKIYGKDGKEFYICYGQVAQPFMYPALKKNKKYIKQLFKQGVKDNLTKNCKGGR